MRRPPALVLLNPAARHGRARRLWDRVRREVEGRFESSVVTTDPGKIWRADVRASLRAGTRVFVAAGGDGTVHALAGAIVESRGGVPLGDICIGAVGLGSSNDFHKPFGCLRSGIPLRLDVDRAMPRDLGRIRWVDAEGRDRESVLVVSASVGVVAEGNALFTSCPFGRYLPSLAMAVAAVRAIARNRSSRFFLRHDESQEEIELSSLSVLKTQWLSGLLRYDCAVAPDDGLLGVAFCEAMGRRRLLGTLAGLARGRFTGRPGTRAFRTAALELGADTPFLLEIDGEISSARHATFDVFPERLLACA
jgi:diacylglycerol kinase family enzyme